jgi:hypothetical protein
MRQIAPTGAVGTLAPTAGAAENNDNTAAAAAPSSADDEVPAAGVGLYAPYLLECIERDGSQTVGLGLPMWILVLAFVLLSGGRGMTKAATTADTYLQTYACRCQGTVVL